MDISTNIFSSSQATATNTKAFSILKLQRQGEGKPRRTMLSAINEGRAPGEFIPGDTLNEVVGRERGLSVGVGLGGGVLSGPSNVTAANPSPLWPCGGGRQRSGAAWVMVIHGSSTCFSLRAFPFATLLFAIALLALRLHHTTGTLFIVKKKILVLCRMFDGNFFLSKRELRPQS